MLPKVEFMIQKIFEWVFSYFFHFSSNKFTQWSDFCFAFFQYLEVAFNWNKSVILLDPVVKL